MRLCNMVSVIALAVSVGGLLFVLQQHGLSRREKEL